MAEKNNRGGLPPRRRPASEPKSDTGPRTSRNRRDSQARQEARNEQPGVAQPPYEKPASEEQPAQLPADELVPPGLPDGEAREVATGESAGAMPEVAEAAVGGESAESGEVGRRERHRTSQNNALGMLIEQHFEDPTAPCRSYSDLERRSRISREALSRYVTTRPDRRRSPTIDSLVAIADAMHLSLESVARAAAAASKGIIPPQAEVQQLREDLVRMPVSALSDEQFSAVLELLIQMRPLGPGSSGSRRLIPHL